jgi:hypothetical protein
MTPYLYDISGAVRIESAFRVDEFEDHRVTELDEVDVRLMEYTDGKPRGECRFGKYVWNERERTATVDLGPGLRGRLRVLEDSVEFEFTPLYFRTGQIRPLLLWSISHTIRRKGGGMLYAAGVARPDGGGALLFGPPGIGKTTTAARLAREWDHRLLGDDKVLVDDGTVHGIHQRIGLRHDSPVRDRVGAHARSTSTAGSTVHDTIRRVYRSVTPRWTRRLVEALRSRLFDVEQHGFFAASAVAPTVDRAPLEYCLLLRPSTDRVAVDRVGVDEIVYRATQTNLTNPGIKHDLVTTYVFCDTREEFFLSLGDGERIGALLRDCVCYEVHAPTEDLCRVIAEEIGRAEAPPP